MDQSSSTKILGKLGLSILAISLFDLLFLNWWVYRYDKLKVKNENVQQRVIERDLSPSPTPVLSPAPSPAADNNVEKDVKVSTVNRTETVVQTSQKEIFIPLGSSSTKSNSYAELAGLEVTIDPSKYWAIDSMIFEASLWVDGGNGRAWAQLYVVDDKNPLIESQVSNPTSSGVLKSSGKIPIPSASKTFRVQAKTDLVDYAAHVENARIKITLR